MTQNITISATNTTNSIPGGNLLAILAAGLCVALCGCGTAQVSRRQFIGAPPTAKPATIYVADFELDAADVKAKGNVIPTPPPLPSPLGDVVPPLPGMPKEPGKLSRKVVNEMSESLVKDLTKAGIAARRLPAGAPLPKSGWLVHGVFTDVNQGSQLSRAVLGFGVGKTDLQVVVDINDLTGGVPRKFYELNTSADSGKAPGTGPTFVTAARIVIAGTDLDRNVKQAASKIAKEIVERTEQSSGSRQASL